MEAAINPVANKSPQHCQTRRLHWALVALIALAVCCRHSPEHHGEGGERDDETIEDCLSYVGEPPSSDLKTAPVVVSGPELIVDDEPVSRPTFERFVKYYAPLAKDEVVEGFDGEVRGRFIEWGRQQRIFEEERVDVTRGDVEEVVGEVRSRFPTEQAYSDFLVAVDVTPRSLRAAICRDLRLLEYEQQQRNLSVTSAEERSFYEAHRYSFEATERAPEAPDFERVQDSIGAYLEAARLYVGVTGRYIERERDEASKDHSLAARAARAAESPNHRVLVVPHPKRTVVESAEMPSEDTTVSLWHVGGRWLSSIQWQDRTSTGGMGAIPGLVVPANRPFTVRMMPADVPGVIVLAEHDIVWEAMPSPNSAFQSVGSGAVHTAAPGDVDPKLSSSRDHLWRRNFGALAYRHALYIDGWEPFTSSATADTARPTWALGAAAERTASNAQYAPINDYGTYVEKTTPGTDAARLYDAQECAFCHGYDGRGGAFRGSGFESHNVELADREWGDSSAIRRQLITTMFRGDHRDHARKLSDRQIAGLLNFVTHTWGSSGPVFSGAQVRETRRTIEVGRGAGEE